MTPTGRARTLCAASLVLTALLVLPGSAVAQSVRRVTDGVAVAVGDAQLRLQVCRESIVRVMYARRASFFGRDSLMTIARAIRTGLPNASSAERAVAYSDWLTVVDQLAQHLDGRHAQDEGRIDPKKAN